MLETRFPLIRWEQSDTGDRFKFVHLSFQEFYMARRLVRTLPINAHQIGFDAREPLEDFARKAVGAGALSSHDTLMAEPRYQMIAQCAMQLLDVGCWRRNALRDSLLRVKEGVMHAIVGLATPTAMDTLTCLLEKNERVIEVHFSKFAGLTGDSMHCFCEAYERCWKHVKHISLYVGKAKVNSTDTDLKLAFTGMSSDDAAILGEWIVVPVAVNRVTSADVSGNSIGNQGMQDLTKVRQMSNIAPLHAHLAASPY